MRKPDLTAEARATPWRIAPHGRQRLTELTKGGAAVLSAAAGVARVKCLI